MPTEFYRSQSEFLPTFSLVLAVSIAGLNAGVRSSTGLDSRVADDVDLPTSIRCPYYVPAQEAQHTPHQAEALQRFAESLLAKTEDSPQAVVTALNQHFWDLV